MNEREKNHAFSNSQNQNNDIQATFFLSSFPIVSISVLLHIHISSYPDIFYWGDKEKAKISTLSSSLDERIFDI